MKLNHLFLTIGIAPLFLICAMPSYCQESKEKTLDDITSLTELATWLEDNPPEVVPLSGITGKRILSQTLTTLRQNVEKLCKYLRNNGEIGAKWAKVLSLEELQKAVSQPTPDFETLEKLYKRFHSHQWGLEITEIRQVAKGLNSYLLLRMTIEENIDPSDGLKEAINRLISVLKKSNKPTFETTREINEIVNWLEDYQQAEDVCQAIKRLSGNYNIFAQVSDNLVLKFFNRPVEKNQHSVEYILGKPQTGRIHTVGEVTGKFNPDPKKVNLSVILNAVATGSMISQTRNITVSSASNSKLYGIKDIHFDGQRLLSLPARSSAQVRSTITGINSPGGLVQTAATNRVYELKPQAEAEGAYKARVQVENLMNNEVGSMIAKTNAQFKQISELYRARGLYPSPFDCCTTEHTIMLSARVSDGIPVIMEPVPQVPDKSDVFIAVHQSAIMEACKTMLGDLKANQRVFMAIARSMLPEDAYKELSKKAAQNKNNDSAASGGNIYFNDQYPVNVQFVNNTITIDLRIDAFQGKTSSNPQEIPMNLSSAYKIDRIDKKGVWFVRIKEPELVPRDFEIEVRKLTTQETTLRNRLQGEFNDMFPPSFQIPPLKLEQLQDKNDSNSVKLDGTIVPVSAKAANGWLTINWQLRE